MDKETVRGFLQWLERATDEEIEARRQKFLNARKQVSGRDARADIALGLRLIDEELVARQGLWSTQT